MRRYLIIVFALIATIALAVIDRKDGVDVTTAWTFDGITAAKADGQTITGTASTNFPTGWDYKLAITVTNTLIDADLTDWTMVFDQSFDSVLTSVNGPLDADGTKASLNGGGDVRFSSDSAGTNRLACDVRTWVTDNAPTGATCEVAIQIPSVSSSAETTIYMWWGKSGETQPAVAAAYGQYAAYDSSFNAVYTLNEDPSGSAPQMSDRTSNANNGTSGGSMTSGDSVAGVVGNSLDFDGGDDDVDLGTTQFINSSQPFTVSTCVNLDSFTASFHSIFNSKTDAAENWRLFFSNAGGYNDVSFGSAAGWTNYRGPLQASTAYIWNHIVVTYDGVSTTTQSSFALYQNGSSASLNTASGYGGDQGNSYIATSAGGHRWNGLIDEIRLSSVEHSAAWIKASYNNQFDTTGFLTWGTITDN